MKRSLILLSVIFLMMMLFSCKPREQVETPTFNLPIGMYTGVQSITISCATDGAEIRYTTDGTEPSEIVGEVYSSAIEVSATTPIKAIAYKDGMDNSAIATVIYIIQTETPTFNIPSGTYPDVQSITISCATTDAETRYTLDGTNPSETEGLVYLNPIEVSANTTIRAISYKEGMVSSTIRSAIYNIRVVAPTFSVPSGTYDGFQSITISCSSAGAFIRYTLDGTNPSETVGTVYSTPVKISDTKTLKAMSYKSGMVESDIASADYIIPYRDFVSVTGGTFSGQGFDHIISDFQMGKYEVTYNLWYEVRQWAISNGYTFANPGREGRYGTNGAEPTAAKYEPVTYVNWRDMIVWCNAYSEMMDYTSCYTYEGSVVRDSTNTTACDNSVCNWVANGYRLPTEGEWQYAASYIDGSSWLPYNHASGDVTSYCYPSDGDTSTVFGDYAWYDGNSGGTTHDVGTKNANLLGIYDMSGNVFEWCWDRYGTYPTNAQIDYRGPTSGSDRVGRGGGWYNYASNLQVGYRISLGPGYVNDNLGFRVGRLVP